MAKPADKTFDLTSTTLVEAQGYLMSKARGKDGSLCPCCRQLVKVVDRNIDSQMARALIILYRYFEKAPDFVHFATYLDELAQQVGAAIPGGQWAKLRFWGLIEEKPKNDKSDGAKRAGFWKITAKGISFVKMELKVPKYAMVYNEKCIGYAPGCVEVNIVDCLGRDFVYDELMAGKYADTLNF